jgi:hypothetical protein
MAGNAPSSLSTGPSSNPTPSYSSSAATNPKARQYSHLHSRLATLNAHLADLENLVRMTSVQAGDMRFLGGYVGGMFMGASKVLGEEGVVSGRKEGDEERGKEG